MSVSDIIASADIVVFQSPSCPYCRMAISALLEAGYEPTIIDASSSQRSELLEITSRSSVPSIWVKGKYVGGCNDGPGVYF
jgi:glutaredoxin 3